MDDPFLFRSDSDNACRQLDASIIPGLRFRRFRGEEDFPAMAELQGATQIADQLDYVVTEEDLRHDYEHAVNFDPSQDVIMAEIQGRLIGYNEVWWRKEENTGTYLYQHCGYVRPEWRNRGLGRTLFHAAERRLREIAAGHPQDMPHNLKTLVYQHQKGLEKLIIQEGYTPARLFYKMVRPLDTPIPEILLPPGLEVRPVQPEHYRAVWEAEQEAFRDHWGHQEPQEGMYERWLNSPIFNPELWQIAWDGDQIAGMVQNFIDHGQNRVFQRQRGYTETIGVRRPWRGRGLARALLTRSLKLHQSLGMTEAALSVDSENPSGALRLYQDVGFRMVDQITAYEKPLTL